VRTAGPALKRPALLFLLALIVGSACGPVVRPGDYRLGAVPALSTVGPAAYMAWFEANAVTPETVVFVEGHGPALEAAVKELTTLAATVKDARVKTRRNNEEPGKPGLKEPRKVEEKIYRDLVKSRAHWQDHRDGKSDKVGDFPEATTPAEARTLVLGAAPQDPIAIRDIAGVRLIVPDLPAVRAVEELVRKHYGNRIIRFKDFLGTHYRGDGYRSVHFVIIQAEKPVEIQIRTEAQNHWARWEHHLVYKGRFKQNQAVRKYTRTVAEILHQRETDTCPPPCTLPECPRILHEADRCFKELPQTER